MKLLTLLLITISGSLTSADIPSPACHNPMPRTPPIGKSPFVTNTWNFLELLSGTQQFLQMTSTMRDNTRVLYSVLVRMEQSNNVYIPYFPFSQAMELYTHIVERKLHCWPFPKYLAFYLIQLRDLNIRGRIETYEPKELRVPNPVREVPQMIRENQAARIIKETPKGVRETAGTVRGTPRTSDRDTFRVSDRETTGKMEGIPREGFLAASSNVNNQKSNTNDRQPSAPYRLFGNEGTSGGAFDIAGEDSNIPSSRFNLGGLSAFSVSRKQTPQKPAPPESRDPMFGSNLMQPLPGNSNFDGLVSGIGGGGGGYDLSGNDLAPPTRRLFGGSIDVNAQRQADWLMHVKWNSNNFIGPTRFENTIGPNSVGDFRNWFRVPDERDNIPPNNPGNPIVIGDSIEEEEKEAGPRGGMEIEPQPGADNGNRLRKRGNEDIPGSTRDRKLPTLYANPLRAFQTSIEDFWSPIFDFLVSDKYLGFNQEQIRPAWQVALPWREYGDTLKKVSTILQVWQKDREVKQRVLTVEQLEARFGHLLEAMKLGRLVTPYPRRPEDEVHIEEDDEELTVEEPSYG
ncbi:hypothetical protein TWF718_001795 [Orbilia javanica]|uniref:Uncharacterized protein n=1 Tax=Orbilia javanica TaxID=47235 RepID=A0AAN8NA87_9PEZI